MRSLSAPDLVGCGVGGMWRAQAMAEALNPVLLFQLYPPEKEHSYQNVNPDDEPYNKMPGGFKRK